MSQSKGLKLCLVREEGKGAVEGKMGHIAMGPLQFLETAVRSPMCLKLPAGGISLCLCVQCTGEKVGSSMTQET